MGLMTGGMAYNEYPAGPSTPHGRTLLTKNLGQMNLPPEEWALEVKELNAQLVECLEQLYEREAELGEQRSTLGSLEENLVSHPALLCC
jgi:hypothetical protein